MILIYTSIHILISQSNSIFFRICSSYTLYTFSIFSSPFTASNDFSCVVSCTYKSVHTRHKYPPLSKRQTVATTCALNNFFFTVDKGVCCFKDTLFRTTKNYLFLLAPYVYIFQQIKQQQSCF